MTITGVSAIKGNSLVVVTNVQCGLGCSGIGVVVTDSLGNVFTTQSFSDGSGATIPYNISTAPITKGGLDVITVAATPTNANYNTQAEAFQLIGPITFDLANALHSVTAPTLTFNSITTTTFPDTILACTFLNAPTTVYTEGSGWYMNPVMQGGLAPFASMGCEVQNQASAGTYTPTMTATGSGGGFTIAAAFHVTASGSFGNYYFGWPRWQDLVAGGDVPVLTGSGECLTDAGVNMVGLTACAAGTVTSVSGTASQIDSTGGATPVISLDGQFTSVNYATCTNTADALTVTLSPAPTSLVNGLTVQCRSSAANTTTTPTLKIGTLTAHTIVKGGSSGQQPLVANDILTNMASRFTYNATATTWELQNPQQLAAGSGTVTSIATTAPIGGGPITTTGTLTCATCVVASSPGAGIARFAGSTQTATSAELSGDATTSGSNSVTVVKVNGASVPTSDGIVGTNGSGQFVAATVTHICEIVWGGSGTSFALTAGDDAIANQSCLNTLGVTETITAVQCRSDNASNTTTVNPTFGSAGTGTTICSGALTCGNSGAYSSTCTVSNASLTSGSNINPVMGGTLTGTSIHLVVTTTASK